MGKLHSKPNLFSRSHCAFTLAEVLITLAIIGVVAALTIPGLIQQHKKLVVETKLAKFYSVINQAVSLAEVDYGDKKYWGDIGLSYEMDEEGNIDKTKSIPQAWFDKYMKPYLNIIGEKTNGDKQGSVLVYFPDGSMAVFRSYAIVYFPDAKNYDLLTYDDGNTYLNETGAGKTNFTFAFWPHQEEHKYHYNKGVEPYTNGWDGTKEGLLTGYYGCNQEKHTRAYCTKLIQMNGWKIPKDYPLKF